MLLLAQGCKITKHLNEGEYLLVKNEIKINDNRIDKSLLAEVIKQRPNRKLFGFFRVNLRMYNFGNYRKDGFIKRQMEKIGESPVLIDSTLSAKSNKQLSLWLFNHGYFENEVTYSSYFKGKKNPSKKKKVIVTYSIHVEKPYTLRRVTHTVQDTTLEPAYKQIVATSLLKLGANYNAEILEAERERIAKGMKNRGYFAFEKEYIFFKVDSALKKNKFDIEVIVKEPITTDTLRKAVHTKYRINTVSIITDFDPETNSFANRNEFDFNGYKIVNHGKLVFKPEILIKSIFIRPGELYSLTNTEYSYSRLSALKTFKFINVRFTEVGSNGDEKLLDCTIELTRSARQAISVETTGTNRAGNLGIYSNIVYSNKNSFKGAETIQFIIKGGLEAQKPLSNTETNTTTTSALVTNYTPFNTLQLGSELSLNMPELLLPKVLKKLPSYQKPYTSISLSYQYQERLLYKGTTSNIGYGYHWTSRKNNSFAVYPIEVSFVQIEKDSIFIAQLNEINNTALINQYTSHLISNSRISYIYSNKANNNKHNFSTFRADFEAAGNMLRLIGNATSANLDSLNSYEIFNIRFAQYVRSEIDFRRVVYFDKKTSIVYRGYGGIGVPLSNLNVLPFEKSFFAGGTNGIRAWQARSLGPGGTADSSGVRIDKIGDLKLEGNAEYRFEISRMLEGAAFIDAGNIWLLKKDEKRPNAEFDFANFYNQIAIGAGLGARIKLSFFIIRFDLGYKLKDPALVNNEQWIFQSKDTTNAQRFALSEASGGNIEYIRYKRNPVLSFGIGYPF